MLTKTSCIFSISVENDEYAYQLTVCLLGTSKMFFSTSFVHQKEQILEHISTMQFASPHVLLVKDSTRDDSAHI